MIGSIAVCPQAGPGLITGSRLIRDGQRRRLFTGISLRDGKPWASVRQPRIVGTIDDVLGHLDTLTDFVHGVIMHREAGSSGSSENENVVQ